MMAKRPDDRFQSAAEVDRALQQWKSTSQSKAVVLLSAVEQEEGDAAPTVAAARKTPSSPGKGGTRGARESGATPVVKKSPSAASEWETAAGGVRRRPAQHSGASGLTIAVVVGVVLAGVAAVGGAIVWLSQEKSKPAATAEKDSSRESKPKGPVHKPDPFEDVMNEKRHEQDAPASRPKSETANSPQPKPVPLAQAPPPGAPVNPSPSRVAPGPAPTAQPEPRPNPQPQPQPQPPAQTQPQPQPVQPQALPPAPLLPEVPASVSNARDPWKEESQAAQAGKPAVARPVGPLAGLRPAALPAVDDVEPVSLGKVSAEAADSLGVKMLNAGGDAPKFVLRRNDDSGGKEGWIIAAASPGAEKDASAAVDVARLWLDERELKFQWLKSADDKADCLRNCGVLIAAGGVKRFLPFLLPVEKTAQLVDLDRGTVTVKFEPKRSSLPDAAAMHLRVVGLDGSQFPQHQLKLEAAAGKKPEQSDGDKPEAATDATPIPVKGKADILFTEANLSAYGLRISFDVKGRAAVVSVSVIHKASSGRDRSSHESAYVPFKPREAVAARKKVKIEQAEYSDLAFNARDPKTKKAAQDQLKAADEKLDQINALDQAMKRASNLQFRVCTEVSGDGETQQVDLFRIAPEEPQGSAAADEAASNLRRLCANLRP